MAKRSTAEFQQRLWDLLEDEQAADDVATPAAAAPAQLVDAPAADWLGGEDKRETDPNGSLFETGREWQAHWKGMPDFAQKNLMPFQSVVVHFRNVDERAQFATLVGQQIGARTRFIWYPKAELVAAVDKHYIDGDT